MLSKSKIKLFNSLALKKKRDELKLFCAEGEKCVSDLSELFVCETLVATKEWLSNHQVVAKETLTVEDEDLKKISFLKTPAPVFAVFTQPQNELKLEELSMGLSLVLDGIQDPGNLGTIVRVADWFGIRHLICSPDTVDIFNPKALQATMGAIARVQLHYIDLKLFFEQVNTLGLQIPIYGTFLQGEEIYTATLSKKGLIVMGNEGSGISDLVRKYISHELFIPNFPKGAPTSESLNVAMATGIVCSEFRRR